MITVAVLVGSLRKASINKRLAKAFAHIGNDIIKFVEVPLDDMPFFNQDIEGTPPASVVHLRETIAKADALLCITPEYNRSIPAVMKNAIDWGSRPYGKNCLSGKPCATAGMSMGSIGSALAQTHLRGILLMLDMPVLGQPEMFIGNAAKLIDENGKVDIPETEKYFRAFLEKFATWVKKQSA